MWIIISILLVIVCLVSLGVQHEQRKEIEAHKYANELLLHNIKECMEDKYKQWR
ncbi:DUF1514 family protein [Staphylococcus haemolyticus]|uniref:DUF1514 family protein n=2 Tax=Staphylococcus haemolyticus TaxID=1283 RepID=UPI0015D93D90|nr:DUF1514 family protein [Staphylococcus haemolyticus]